MCRPKRNYLPQGVEVIFSDIEVIQPQPSRVKLTKDSRVLHYDQLIIATGTRTYRARAAESDFELVGQG